MPRRATSTSTQLLSSEAARTNQYPDLGIQTKRDDAADDSGVPRHRHVRTRPHPSPPPTPDAETNQTVKHAAGHGRVSHLYGTTAARRERSTRLALMAEFVPR